MYLADRTSEALEALSQGEATLERTGERYSRPEYHRLRDVFLAALGANETQVEASLCAAISTARQQKAISLGEPIRTFALLGVGTSVVNHQ